MSSGSGERPKQTRSLSVSEAVRALREGSLVVLPTETVYGLAADALNTRAVARIFEAKRRPTFNPLICHLGDFGQLPRFATIPKWLTGDFWPGPITVLLPHEGRIPSIVTAGSPYCAFRVPDHPLALAVLREFDGPVAAPSANVSGRVSPTTAAMATAGLGNAIAGFVDGGSCRLGIESTVVVPVGEDRTLRILRPGAFTEEQLVERGFRVLPPDDSGRAGPPPSGQGPADYALSPGTQMSHYAPSKPVALVEAESRTVTPTEALSLFGWARAQGWARLLLLCYAMPEVRAPEAEAEGLLSENLSSRGDSAEAAANLFALLDRADHGAADGILAFVLPEVGLGRAINDRLRRASSWNLTRSETGWTARERSLTST